MKESKALKDEVSFNFCSSNLERLEEQNKMTISEEESNHYLGR